MRALLASGDLPCRFGLVVRSIGALGDAGEERSLELVGELGGKIDEFRRFRGVIGGLIGVLVRGDTGTGCEEGLVRGDGLRGEYEDLGD